jgi:hypothetical protein
MSLEDTITVAVESAVTRALGPMLARMHATDKLTADRAPDKLLYAEPTAAEMLGVAPLTLKKWRCRGLVRAHTRPGARPALYSRADLERIAAWLATREGGE